MSTDSHYLESVLHHDIPLTRDMGLPADMKLPF